MNFLKKRNTVFKKSKNRWNFGYKVEFVKYAGRIGAPKVIFGFGTVGTDFINSYVEIPRNKRYTYITGFYA